MMEIWVPELIPWKKEEEFKNRIMRPQHLKVRGKEFWIEGHPIQKARCHSLLGTYDTLHFGH